MTHKDIYTKFLIEYDKANVTSSYPSLTKYEIATILDKSYNALISQKISGNNIRRSSFETDVKSVSDLQPLVKKQYVLLTSINSNGANVVSGDIPLDFLYFIQAQMFKVVSNSPLDNNNTRLLPIKLVPHDIAQKFIITPYNMPWVKVPVCYIEDGKINIIYDSVDTPNIDSVNLTYIKLPVSFIPGLDSEYVQFECNSTVAEELISLAVIFALENVESSRLLTKLNTKGLEA